MRQLALKFVALMVQLLQEVRQIRQLLAWQRLQHLHGEYVHQYLLPLPLQDLRQVQMQACERLE
jgi:hypothetical protein